MIDRDSRYEPGDPPDDPRRCGECGTWLVEHGPCWACRKQAAIDTMEAQKEDTP